MRKELREHNKLAFPGGRDNWWKQQSMCSVVMRRTAAQCGIARRYGTTYHAKSLQMLSCVPPSATF
ncbi:hypothetical protein IG631_06143 [Alternaria alternata]|nr:hypothetical protein IG631_06143 [Alternaria alternata]